ncbi:MAG: NaeI family type II restriction endonuclease [Acidimicrobiales bacterium]
MSQNRFFHFVDEGLPSPPRDLADLVAFFEEGDGRERIRWTLRDSIDEVLDGQRTGRWAYQHLTKTERTYLGTAVEVNMTREFGIADGESLDWRIAGQEVDCKFSKDWGNWSIPMEMYLCADHGEQSGTADHPALLLWADDDRSEWAAGVTRIADEYLAFKQDGSGDRSYNRDNKRVLSKHGLVNIYWLWGGVQNDLPENALLQMSQTSRERVFSSVRSGQARVNELLRTQNGRIVTRATIATVAQQDDAMKRARDARLAKHLPKEGFLVIGHQETDPYVARALGFPPPAKGEILPVAVRVVDESHSGPKAFLVDRWWTPCEPTDATPHAPLREEYKKQDRASILAGAAEATS